MIVTNKRALQPTISTHGAVEHDLGFASAKVNPGTGELRIFFNDLIVGQSTFASSIGHSYHGSIEFLKLKTGRSWKLSFEQFVFPYSSDLNLIDFQVGDYAYLDEEGVIHRFVKGSNGYYYDKTGIGAKLTITNNSDKDKYSVEFSNQFSIIFDKDGRIRSKIYWRRPNYYAVSYEYDLNDQLVKICDGRQVVNGVAKKHINLEYQNSMLHKISHVINGVEQDSVYYSYKEDNLINVAKYHNNSLYDAYAFEYDSKNHLVFCCELNKEIGHNFVYTKDKLTQIIKTQAELVVPKNGDVSEDYVSLTGGEYAMAGTYMIGTKPIELKPFSIEKDLGNTSLESTLFIYKSPSYTDIKNSSDVIYRYYLNSRKDVLSVLEEIDGSLHTLVKDSGVSVMKGSDTDGINNSPKIDLVANVDLLLYKKEHEQSSLDLRIFESYREKFDENKPTIGNNAYNVSFWIKSTTNYGGQIRAKVVFDTFLTQYYNWAQTNNFYAKIDNNAVDSWQQVSLTIPPITDEFNFIKIIIESSYNDEFELSNIRFVPVSYNKLALKSFYNHDVRNIRQVELKKWNGSLQVINLEDDDCFSARDVMYNLQSLAKGGAYDFKMSGLTKVFPNILAVQVRFNESASWVELDGNSIMLYEMSPGGEVISETDYKFASDRITLDKKTIINKKNHTSRLVYNSFGELIEQVDSYNIKTIYKHDDYGNLVEQITAKSSDFDATGKEVKSGCFRKIKNYQYNDTLETKLREQVTLETDGINKKYYTYDHKDNLSDIKFNYLSKQSFDYDTANRIGAIYSLDSNNQNKIGNTFLYDDKGRLLSYYENDKYKFEQVYDIYGNVTKGNIVCDNKTTTISDVKNYPYSMQTGYSAVSNLTNQTTANMFQAFNKYGMPQFIEFSKSDSFSNRLVFTYQYNKAKLIENDYAIPLNESPALAKLIKLYDNKMKVNHKYEYDEFDRMSGYVIRNHTDTATILSIKQITQNETKYDFAGTKFKTKLNYNDNLVQPRITSINHHYDIDGNSSDNWKAQTRFDTNYKYDDLTGNIIEITSDSNTALSSNLKSKVKEKQDIKYRNIANVAIDQIGDYEVNIVDLTETLNGNDVSKAVTITTDNKFKYAYDNNGNIHGATKITNIKSSEKVLHVSNYDGYEQKYYSTTNKTILDRTNQCFFEYDEHNRLLTEVNPLLSVNYRYIYQNSNGVDINRITKIVDRNNTGRTLKSFNYDKLNRLTHYYKEGTINKEYTYKDNYLLPVKVNGNDLVWGNGNRLEKYGNYQYHYDLLLRRVKKVANGVTIEYHYDGGNRLLGEDRSDGIKLRYIYDLTGIRGIKYIKNGQISDYGFIKDGLNNIVGIVSSGLSVVEYTYDAWGSSSLTRTDDVNNIGNLNPFRWKSHYYDNETGMYYINGRYYEDEIGQFITPDYASINPLVIGGLNPYGLGVSNPLMFGVNQDNNFSALSLYSDIPTPGSSGPNWLSWILSGAQFAAGVGLMFVPGGQGIGAMMIAGGALGLAGNAFGSQIGSGFGSIVNGTGAFATGLSLLSYGPIGWVCGGILMAVGAGTAIMGTNEVYSGISGTNGIRDWMGNGLYDGLYLGLNIGSAVGQIIGNYYLGTHAKVSDLHETHGRTLSKRKYNELRTDVNLNGIKTPLDVVKYKGTKYVVNGNHRLMIARSLNVKIVRINYVRLPFLGYISPENLFY